MIKPIYLIRVVLQAVIMTGIYFLYCSNPDGSFSLKLGWVSIWLVISFICQFYLMRFRGLYPRSAKKVKEQCRDVGEINFFVAVAILVVDDLLGPIISAWFYVWDHRINGVNAF